MSSGVKELDTKVEEKQKKDFRDSIYGRIDVSVKMMDRIIIGLFILILLSIFLGVII